MARLRLLAACIWELPQLWGDLSIVIVVGVVLTSCRTIASIAIRARFSVEMGLSGLRGLAEHGHISGLFLVLEFPRWPARLFLRPR